MKKSPTVLIVGSTVLLTGLGSGILVGRHYLTDNLGLLENNGWARFLLNTVISHCRDFGELIVNAPLSKLPSWCQVPILVLGACSMLMFFVGVAVLWSRSRWLSAYLIGGCILVLPWPYTDPRFWLPILPFAFVAIFLGSLTIAKRGRLNLTAPLPWALAYSALFCCLGLASLGYSTWITFSGPQFPYRYGDGLLRSTYLTGCSLPGGHTNRSALHLLRQYEWHCRQAAGNASERAIASQF